MRNGIAFVLIVLLASGVWFIRRTFPKAGDPLEETHALAADTNPPALPTTPAPSDTKLPDTTSAPPPPPPADTQPSDTPPQTIPITDAVQVTGVVTNVTEVPNLMDDAQARADQHVFYRFRLGYDHTQFGRGGDTWHLGAQFNVRPQAWYGNSPSLMETLLVPDMTAEIGHAGIGTTVNKVPTTGDGVRTDLSLFWPWLNWGAGEPTDSLPSRWKVSLGPTAYGAYQQITSIDVSEPDWERYGGVRLMLNHDAFVEYTVGKTDSLPDRRYQLTAEFPIYQRAGSDVRYVVRGMWNSAYNSDKDLWGVSLLVEFPFNTLEHPSKFRDLLPFADSSK